MTTIAILGAGNGGFAAAAHLSSQGHRTQLYNRSEGTIAAVREAGGIEYSGVPGEGFADVAVVTTDLAEALEGADLVMVCLPANALGPLAAGLAPHLDGATPLLLNPGGVGGALAVRQVLRSAGLDDLPPVAETNTLTYICRKRSDEHVYVSSLVENVRCGVLPVERRDEVVETLLELYPSLTPVPDVLHTALSSVNAVLHPPGVVLSTAWIEHTEGDFRFYYDAGTPAVARVMADLDEDRLAIADAWDVDVEPFPAMFADIGSTSRAAGESGDFHRMLQESEPNKDIRAPPSVDHRYFHEDIPFGLVPMATLGRLAGVETPVVDSLVTIAASVAGRDYRSEGWTAADLGVEPGSEPTRAALFGQD
jgi:opine dehydrogenase